MRYTICSALLLTAAACAQAAPLTAREAVAKIVAANGVTLPSDTVDTFKAGDLDTPVTGVATTFMDSMKVLREAVAHGDNLIVTHEPTFYNHRDDRALLPPGDPVLAEKLKYIADHRLVVWRFHDGWHRHQPDGILTGVVEQLGLKQDQQGGAGSPFFTLPAPVPLGRFAEQLQTRTGAVAVRVVGDPTLPVTRVALLLGAAGGERQIAALARPDVQVLVVGESTEWETIPYAQDASEQGRPKALILLGHNISEEAGMKTCAVWLRGVLPGVRVDFLPSGEAFSAVLTRGAPSAAARP